MQPKEYMIWLQTAFLGDIILSTAAISLAKKKFPSTNQILITTPAGKAALNKHPDLEKIVSIDKKKLGFLETIETIQQSIAEFSLTSKNTVVLQPHQSTKSSIICKLLGFPTITFKESSLSFLACQRVSRVAVFHESTRVALLLEPLGIKRQDLLSVKPSLPNSNSSGGEIGNRTRPTVVALAPGSAWPTKQWPAEKFARLCKKLLALQSLSIIVLGAKNEIKLAKQIARGLSTEAEKAAFTNLCGKTSLQDLNSLYPTLSLLVSNDSSPIHYSSAHNTPCVAIFGATSSKMGFGPLASESRVIEIDDLKCRPCSVHGQKKCPLQHFRCMEDISVERVFEACQQTLARGDSSFVVDS